MGFAEFTFGITFISIVVGGLVKIADRIFGTKGKATAAELTAAQDRIRALESQLVDAHHQNDQLSKQLEWHTKLLETQDRLVAQLSEAAAHTPAAPALAAPAVMVAPRS